MSTLRDHKVKAAHNETLAASLTAPFYDWAVTVYFYAAVQYIEAHFSKNMPPFHSPSHYKRDSAIGLSKTLKPIWRDYRELKNQSGLARYEAHINFKASDVSKAKAKLDTIKSVIIPTL